jgi:hypothetical protein
MNDALGATRGDQTRFTEHLSNEKVVDFVIFTSE